MTTVIEFYLTRLSVFAVVLVLEISIPSLKYRVQLYDFLLVAGFECSSTQT